MSGRLDPDSDRVFGGIIRRAAAGKVELPRERKPPPAIPYESHEQKMICQWLGAHRLVYNAVPNHLSPSTRDMCKRCVGLLRKRWAIHVAGQRRQGLQRGVCDIEIKTPPPAAPSVRIHIEVKRQGEEHKKNRGCSDEQLAWHAKLPPGDVVIVGHAGIVIEKLEVLYG